MNLDYYKLVQDARKEEIEVNLAKLKGVLVEKGRTYADMAEVLGISKTTVVNKLSGRSDFDINEANKIANWLGLSTEERLDIFFAK